MKSQVWLYVNRYSENRHTGLMQKEQVDIFICSIVIRNTRMCLVFKRFCNWSLHFLLNTLCVPEGEWTVCGTFLHILFLILIYPFPIFCPMVEFSLSEQVCSTLSYILYCLGEERSAICSWVQVVNSFRVEISFEVHLTCILWHHQ